MPGSQSKRRSATILTALGIEGERGAEPQSPQKSFARPPGQRREPSSPMTTRTDPGAGQAEAAAACQAVLAARQVAVERALHQRRVDLESAGAAAAPAGDGEVDIRGHGWTDTAPRPVYHGAAPPLTAAHDHHAWPSRGLPHPGDLRSLAGSISVLTARYLPGVSSIDQGSLQAIFIMLGATIAFGKAALAQRLAGRWEAPKTDAPSDGVDLPLDDGEVDAERGPRAGRGPRSGAPPPRRTRSRRRTPSTARSSTSMTWRRLDDLLAAPVAAGNGDERHDRQTGHRQAAHRASTSSTSGSDVVAALLERAAEATPPSRSRPRTWPNQAKPDGPRHPSSAASAGDQRRQGARRRRRSARSGPSSPPTPRV